MSDTTALTQLARFVGKSVLSADNQALRQAATAGIVRRLEPRPVHKRASELLGTVLALSARTRRMVQPRVAVDLDVFTPAGKRAAYLTMNCID